MNKVIIQLIAFKNQIELLHWQTGSYARHKSYDEFLEEFSEALDKLVETYQGAYEPLAFGEDAIIRLYDIKEVGLTELMDQTEELLIATLPESIDTGRSPDLLNIRDELLGALNNLKFHLRLK